MRGKKTNSEEILTTKPMIPSDHVSKDPRGLTTFTTDPAIENPAFGPRESSVPQVTLTPPPSDTQTLPSLSPQGLQEANTHLQQLMKIMGGAFQVPPLVYHTPRSQAILAPYGVQIEDPHRQEKIGKGKAVAEEHNRSQSWSGHSDEDSSHSTRTKRKDQRTTNELEEEESVSHKRYNGQRGRSSRKTRTPPRSSGSPLKASRIQQNRKNPSARRHLHFDRSPAKDPEYMQEILQIRDDMQRIERNHRETRGSIRSPGTHHGPFTEEDRRKDVLIETKEVGGSTPGMGEIT
ncbi:hypothetical protein LWI29_036795 [Acer saccharum]|uniref:Uncharacterized protein n=1 Tax=Acer saccharum TaxID=4024 RepID=A0AA39RSG2_ACESA|nr:hypothetical protein LWI29_036795 [Acer saccharum]